MPATWTNTVLPPGGGLKSPSDGTIVRWRIVGASGGPLLPARRGPSRRHHLHGRGHRSCPVPHDRRNRDLPGEPADQDRADRRIRQRRHDGHVLVHGRPGRHLDGLEPTARGRLHSSLHEPLWRRLRDRLQRRRPLLRRSGADRQEPSSRQARAGRSRLRPRQDRQASEEGEEEEGEVHTRRERRRRELDLRHSARRPDPRQETAQKEAVDGGKAGSDPPARRGALLRCPVFAHQLL